MFIPLLSLFIASLLPYIWGGFQAYGRKQEMGNLDNKNPRLQQAELKGLGARALAAHNNAFEALLVFAPAVIMSQAMADSVDQAWVHRLCVVWVIARIIHGIAYLADQDKIRTMSFFIALLSVISMWTMILGAVL